MLMGERLEPMNGPDEPAETGGTSTTDARLQLLIAEYEWVSGLIRYYREVEVKALAGTGLVLSGVGAAFAALQSSSNPDAVNALGLVFAIAASIVAFVLPVVFMANMRGLRAVVYVREWLHPLAAELVRDPRFLAWESVAERLYIALAGRLGQVLKPVLSAAVVIFLIGTASLLLVVAACTVEYSPWSRAIAAVAAAFDLVFMFTAFRFARLRELRGNVEINLLPEIEKKAARSARFPHAAGGPPR
jgi:hypothetical protein